MGAQLVKCRCPKCKAKYRLPASAVGHRARCRSCRTVFRVPEPAVRIPTEDDILEWLNEAGEKDEAAELRETTIGEWMAGGSSVTDAPAPAEEAPEQRDAEPEDDPERRVVPLQRNTAHPNHADRPARAKSA
jgi:hypothetical protein